MDIKTSFISYICNQITNIEVKMVLEIRLSNMFSFRDEVTLDLQAAKIQTKKARELEGNLFSGWRTDVEERCLIWSQRFG